MANENLLEVDELSLYFGEPYVINDYITRLKWIDEQMKK